MAYRQAYVNAMFEPSARAVHLLYSALRWLGFTAYAAGGGLLFVDYRRAGYVVLVAGYLVQYIANKLIKADENPQNALGSALAR